MVALNYSNIVAMVKIISRHADYISGEVIHKLVNSTRNKAHPKLITFT